MGFRGKIAVLRHLEDFLGKMEESRPPLKLKNNFFYFFSIGQRSFWHAPELSSPTGSTLELRLKMVKNQGFTM